MHNTESRPAATAGGLHSTAVAAFAVGLVTFSLSAGAVTSQAVSTNRVVAGNNQNVQSCGMTVNNNGQSQKTSDCNAVMNAIRSAFGNLFDSQNSVFGNMTGENRPTASAPATRPVMTRRRLRRQVVQRPAIQPASPPPGNNFLNWTMLPRPTTQPQTPVPSAQGSGFDAQELGLINQYRQQNGLNTLSFAPDLMQLALGHSQDMAARQSMDHNGFQQRFQQSGRSRCVENVAWNYNTPSSLFTAWRNSPEHNANMLDPAIQQAGIAISNGYATFLACSAN